MNKYLIESVLGFNLNADITDKDGNIISKGIKSSIIPKNMLDTIQPKLLDKSFFTHFNEELLNKIKQHRRLND